MFDQFYLINRTLNIGLVSTMMNMYVRMLQTFPLRSGTMPKSPVKGFSCIIVLSDDNLVNITI